MYEIGFLFSCFLRRLFYLFEGGFRVVCCLRKITRSVDDVAVLEDCSSTD